MRHECWLENVLGRGDSWAMSGGQWGAWNAAYGPRGTDGRPVPLWDPRTGVDQPRGCGALEGVRPAPGAREELGGSRSQAARQAPHLGGRRRRLLPQQRRAPAGRIPVAGQPAYEGSIPYGPGKGHCWMGISEREMMKQMGSRMQAAGDPP